MPGFIGRLIQVGLGLESPRGSIKSPPDFWLDKVNATIDDKPEVLVDESTIGRIEDSIGGAVVKEGAEGEISGKVWDRSFGLLLLAAIGDVAVPNPLAEGVFEHVFSVKNDAQHPSLTIECKNPNEQLAFVLAMLETLEIRAEVGKYVEYTATFKSKKGVGASNGPVYVPNENNFISKHITLKIADAIGDLDRADPVPVRSVTLRINKNLERDDVFNSLNPNDILNKQFSVEATIVLLHKGIVYKGFFAGGKKKAIRIDMENTDVNLEDSGISPQIIIDLAQALFTGWEKTTGSDDLVMETITAKATYKKTEAKMLDCKLINTQPSYEAGS